MAKPGNGELAVGDRLVPRSHSPLRGAAPEPPRNRAPRAKTDGTPAAGTPAVGASGFRVGSRRSASGSGATGRRPLRRGRGRTRLGGSNLSRAGDIRRARPPSAGPSGGLPTRNPEAPTILVSSLHKTN
jgi:hypothetical protein